MHDALEDFGVHKVWTFLLRRVVIFERVFAGEYREADDVSSGDINGLEAFRVRVIEGSLNGGGASLSLSWLIGPVDNEEAVDGKEELGGVQIVGEDGEVGGSEGCDGG